MPVDEFFDLVAHNHYADIAHLKDVGVKYVYNVVYWKVTEKDKRDGMTRQAVKDELNVRRAANGIIARANLGNHGVHSEEALDHSDAVAQQVISQRERRRMRKSCGSTMSNLASSSAMKSGSELPPNPKAKLPDWEGHEIYEVAEEDFDDGLEDGEIAEDDGGSELKDAEIAEEDFDDAGLLSHPIKDKPEDVQDDLVMKAYAPPPTAPAGHVWYPAILNDHWAWFKLHRLHKFTPELRAIPWQELIHFNESDLEKEGVCVAGARTKFVEVFGRINAALAQGRRVQMRDLEPR